VSLEKAPRLLARTGGVLYLIMIILGIVNELLARGDRGAGGYNSHRRESQVDGVSVAFRAGDRENVTP
jgi:hypothetical protein